MDELIRCQNIEVWEYLSVPTLNKNALPVTDSRASRNTVVIGKRGSGKSTLVKDVVRRCLLPKVIILDYNREYLEVPGIKAVGSPSQLAEHLIQDAYAERRSKLAYVMNDIEDYEQESLSIINALATTFHKGGCLLVIEEAHLTQSPANLPLPIKRLLVLGRHKRLSSIIVTQRPQLLNRQSTAQSEEIITFRVTEQLDLNWLKYQGFDPLEVSNLPRGHCIIKGT